jgi:hypothetical protein
MLRWLPGAIVEWPSLPFQKIFVTLCVDKRMRAISACKNYAIIALFALWLEFHHCHRP